MQVERTHNCVCSSNSESQLLIGNLLGIWSMNEIRGGFAAKLEKQRWWNEATFHEWHAWHFPRQAMGRGKPRWSYLILHYHARHHSIYQSARRLAPPAVREISNNKTLVDYIVVRYLESNLPDTVSKTSIQNFAWLLIHNGGPSLTLRNGIPFSYHKFSLPSKRSWIFGSMHTSASVW